MNENDNLRLLVDKLLSLCFPDLKKENITVYLPDTKGDGYLSSIQFADVNIKSKVLQLVIKLAHQNEEQRNYVDPRNVFERETYFYTTFNSAIKQHQKEKNVPGQFSINIPKCYGTFLMDKSEAIILQDLSKIGYKLWDRKKPMDDHHLTKVLEEYGKLHAASLALRKQNPQQFQNVTSYLQKSDDIFKILAVSMDILPVYDLRFEHVAKMLEAMGDKKGAQKVNNFRKEIPEVVMKYADPCDLHSVVLHGDCWNNNMMFLYEDDSIKPTKMCFLDFQLCRLGSPLMDFSYFFYTCASKYALDNIHNYLKIYYRNLCSCLEAYGCNPENIFPYSIFMDHWRKYSKFGLALSLLLFRLALCDKEEAPALVNGEFGEAFQQVIKNEDVINERTLNVINHFIQNELI